ncbi:histidine kinase [Malaciobacter mytili]|uniref:sensor histidine kinase n=1 Tax=Malaciobacter mytili TaxID=603050 RepID=UPI00100BB999|nr:cache domain-containing protein [Malaciobacter mytili]RXI43776.1 histidine kinase [Malaciobacter mytili]
MKEEEKKILFIIKYTPVIFIFTLCIAINLYFFNNKKTTFQSNKLQLEENFISINKNFIKSNVDEIIYYIRYKQLSTEIELKNKIKNAVENATIIANKIYKLNEKKSKEEILFKIKEVLRDFRYDQDEDSYFFIYDLEGKNILHPVIKYIEGKNLWNYMDKKGALISQELKALFATNDELYYSWYWPKKDNKEYKKLGFFKKIPNLGIYIGTGKFVLDFENNIKNEVINYIANIKLNESGYIFVTNYKGEYLSYYDKKSIGKNIKDYVAYENKDIFVEQLNENAKEGGYITYLHKNKPHKSKTIRKTTYVKAFKDWGWIIGTGFYLDDFYNELEKKEHFLEDEYKKEISAFYKIAIISTIVSLLISLYISKLVEKIFLRYKKAINSQLKENIKKDNLIAYQSKMASMGEMIGNIAHQWRQPLNAISSASSAIKLQKELGVLEDEFENRTLDSINENVQYLSKTIDDFRNFFNKNKQTSKISLNDSISKTLSLVYAQYKNKDIEIIKNIEDIKIKSLENELVQVLINILNNARDELIKIENERFIFINIKDENNSVLIEIKDNAKGIDKKIIDKIFDPYFTTKKDTNGTGIGLYMSKEIVTKHLKGEIKVQNVKYKYNEKMYKGASFIIRLPKEI